MAWQGSELKSLDEKFSQALSDDIAKDSLLKQHAKAAEEATAGWENSEKEAMALKKENDKLAQQKLALENEVSHLDGALKECTRQLRHVKEEHEKKISEAVAKTTSEWDKVKFELDSRIFELEELLLESKVNESVDLDAMQESSKHVNSKVKQQPESDRHVQDKVGLLESENAALKYKVNSLSKEMDRILSEKEESRKSSTMTSKQNSEVYKKGSKTDTRGLPHKRSVATLASVKQDKEVGENDAGELKQKKSFGKGSISSTEFTQDKYLGDMQKEIETLKETLSAMEDEKKMLKETLLNLENELKASRATCARTANKLSSVEEQLEIMKRKNHSLNLTSEASESESPSNLQSMKSVPDGHNDSFCADSWASALIAELDQFKKNKIAGKIERLSDIPNVDLMDDFLEMERLASMPSSKMVESKIKEWSETNLDHSLGDLEEVLIQKEQQLSEAKRNCSDLSRDLAFVSETLEQLKARNSWNELSLASFHEKMELILKAEDEGGDLHGLLKDIRSARAVTEETDSDTSLCIKPHMITESKFSSSQNKVNIIDIELATAISSVVNFVQYMIQQSRHKVTDSQLHKVNLKISGFAKLVDQVMHGNVKVTQLLAELASFLALVRTLSSQDTNTAASADYNGGLNLKSDKDIVNIPEKKFNPPFNFCISTVNFHIIRKLNTIQAEKAALESELNIHVNSFNKLEEEFLQCREENFELQKTIATESEQLENVKKQLDDSKKTKTELENVLKIHEDRCRELEQQLMYAQTQNADLESDLNSSISRLQKIQRELDESNQIVKNLQSCLDSTQSAKKLVDDKMEAEILHSSNISSQLQEAETEITSLHEILKSVRSKLKEKEAHYEDAMEKYKLLEGQLQIKRQNSEYSKQLAIEEDLKKRQERDLAIAAGKLAECQETILSLSRQLKVLACPMDYPLEYSCDENKKSAKDLECELDSPWSPLSQSSSRESECMSMESIAEK